MRYLVNYGTGAGNEWYDTIEEAMAAGEAGARYTQTSICIEDEEGNELYEMPWWGVQYDPAEDDEEPLVDLGAFGYYGQWVER